MGVAVGPAGVFVEQRRGHEPVDRRQPRVGQRELADLVAVVRRDDLGEKLLVLVGSRPDDAAALERQLDPP